MRFQPTIVPRPSARATDTFTQIGMNLVPLSSDDRSDFSAARSASPNPGGLAPITRTASDARYMSLRTFVVAAADTAMIAPKSLTCRAISPVSTASAA